MPDFAQFTLAANIGVFIAAAVAVWIGGTRLSAFADEINARTGAGQAATGLVLLAGVTSLPEIAVTVTSSASGETQLALNNLFGSIAMQVAVLAVVDAVIGRKALTAVIPEPSVMLQGALNVLLLGIAGCAMVAGDVAFFGIGAWSTVCLLAYAGSIFLLTRAKGHAPWLPARRGHVEKQEQPRKSGTKEKKSGTKRLFAGTVVAAAVILVAGYTLSRTGSAIAEQTGLGTSFMGFVFLAASTSLPELSSAIGAARLGRYTMAISDILGTNLINVALVFLIDVAAPGQAILNQADSFAIFGVFLGIVLTSLFVAGLAERRDRTVLRMGIDSLTVMVAYAGGVIILYFLS